MRTKGQLRFSGRSAWTMPIALAASSFALAPIVQAASTPVTFAQVIESAADINPNIYAYLNNGTSAEFGTDVAGVFGAPAAAEFTFLGVLGTPLPADLSGPQDATISLTSSTATPATTFSGLAEEPFTGTSGSVNTLRITRDTPALEGTGTKTNLLTMTFTGTLLGALGGATPQLSGNSGLGDTVTYSSDFVGFVGSTEQDFSETFSSWGPANPPPPGMSVASNGFLNAATAAGTGTFDFQGAATVMPEPSAVPLFAILVLPLATAYGRRVRRRRGLTTAAV